MNAPNTPNRHWIMLYMYYHEFIMDCIKYTAWGGKNHYFYILFQRYGKLILLFQGWQKKQKLLVYPRMVEYTGLPGNYTGVSQEILGYKLQLHTSLILLIISVGM